MQGKDKKRYIQIILYEAENRLRCDNEKTRFSKSKALLIYSKISQEMKAAI